MNALHPSDGMRAQRPRFEERVGRTVHISEALAVALPKLSFHRGGTLRPVTVLLAEVADEPVLSVGKIAS